MTMSEKEKAGNFGSQFAHTLLHIENYILDAQPLFEC